VLRNYRLRILYGHRTSDERSKITTLRGKPLIVKDVRHQDMICSSDDVRTNARLERRRGEAEPRYGGGHDMKGLSVVVFRTAELFNDLDSLHEGARPAVGVKQGNGRSPGGSSVGKVDDERAILGHIQLDKEMVEDAVKFILPMLAIVFGKPRSAPTVRRMRRLVTDLFQTHLLLFPVILLPPIIG
jgi:hypothetical protein